MKINIIRVTLITLLVLTFYMIFNFSNQNGEESSSVSRKVTILITQNIESIQKLEQEELLENIEHIIRKLAHFSIYALVGILMMLLVSTYNISGKNRILISLIIGFLYASSDELHQFFVPERSAMFTDVLIDTLGVSFGIVLVLSAKKLYFLVVKGKNK